MFNAISWHFKEGPEVLHFRFLENMWHCADFSRSACFTNFFETVLELWKNTLFQLTLLRWPPKSFALSLPGVSGRFWQRWTATQAVKNRKHTWWHQVPWQVPLLKSAKGLASTLISRSVFTASKCFNPVPTARRYESNYRYFLSSLMFFLVFFLFSFVNLYSRGTVGLCKNWTVARVL